MRLPNGSILMHDIFHAYDPVKAHQYYLKVRELKGRRPGGKQPLLSVPATTKTIPKPKAKASPAAKAAAWQKFLEALPMVVEGADLKTADTFVKSFQGKPDSFLKDAAAKIKKERGDMDGAQVATINALLAARAKAGSAKPAAPAKGLPAKSPAPKLSPKQLATKTAAAKEKVDTLRNEVEEINSRLKKKMAEAKKAAAKEKAGPTAADKAASAKDSKKYRAKNAQKIANKAKQADAGKTTSDKPKEDTVESLRGELTEAKGRLTAAITKLRTLSAAK